MRMVVISLSILLILLGLWGWFYYTSVKPVTQYYWDNLSNLSETMERGDWERAKENINEYLNRWIEIRKLWIYFINQKDIDNIDSSIRQLYMCVLNEDKILSQVEIQHLINLFNVINENECLSLENIF
ncbi:MAG TPA: DUF4363 family protein [Tissierellia bacterium]|jgi:hypothetical protein|nr:DUF4363 family protein [Tissierellia bacterium]